MKVILREELKDERTMTRKTAPEILIVDGQFFLRHSVSEQCAIYKVTVPEEL